MEEDNRPLLGRDVPWSSIKNRICKVTEFFPFGKVEGKKIIAPKTMPYAVLIVVSENNPIKIYLPIYHKIDFRHLWQAFMVREKNEKEEVIIVWSTDYKNRFLKPFHNYLPKLAVYIYPKGFFEEKLTNPEWHSQFKGEAGFYLQLEELRPMASWKTDLIEWPF